MNRKHYFMLITSLILFANPTDRVSAQNDDKSTVEATVRDYERAVEEFDFDKQISLMLPSGKWIEEDSYPEAADYIDEWWLQAKKAKLRIANRPHDFDIRVQGDVAWVIVFVDVATFVDNEAARAFTMRTHPNEREWVGHFVESEVLIKTTNGWRLALGHVSRLPKNNK